MPPWEKYASGKAVKDGPWAKYAVKDATVQESPQESGLSAIARNIAPMTMAQPEVPARGPYNPKGMPTSFADFEGSRTNPAAPLAGIVDYATLADRAIATTRGMNMNDPGAFIMRPEAEQTRQSVEAQNAANPWTGRAPTSFADFGQNAAPGVGETLLQAVSPSTLMAMAPKKALKLLRGAKNPASLVSESAPSVQKGAERIQQTVLRPRTGDWRSGFDIKNIEKYGVQGSVDEVLSKSQSQIDDAASQLSNLIKEGKDGGARINLYGVIDRAEARLRKEGSADLVSELKPIMKKFRTWAKVESSRGGVNRIGSVDLLEGQKFKQMMGGYGDWEKAADASKALITTDERFQSRAAKAVYDELRKEIENTGPEGIKELNKKLSELIPIRAAAAHRKIVSDRNNPISLKDMIGTVAAIGNGPAGAGMLAANKFTTTGSGAKSLYWLAQKLESAKNPIDASFYEQKLRELGATTAMINAIKNKDEEQ